MTEQRVALVTGASRGIGRSIAVRLAANGHRVAVGYRVDDGGATETCRQIEDAGGSAIAVPGDVSVSDDVDAMFSKIEAEWGPVTVVVNNAGIVRDQLLPLLTDDDWRTVVETNLNGAFFVIRRAYRGLMRSRWGRIVNVGSVSGSWGTPGQANYAASKAGLIGLTRTVARELGKRNITCNVVVPGPIETRMLDNMREDARALVAGLIPLGRIGNADEVGAVVAFLCTDGASYVNGAVIPVDGGMTMGT